MQEHQNYHRRHALADVMLVVRTDFSYQHKENSFCSFTSRRRERNMRIAQIAPPWIPVPPKNYGGTENMIYNLIEEQISQGHKVTLFAPGDAKTSAKHISFFSHSL